MAYHVGDAVLPPGLGTDAGDMGLMATTYDEEVTIKLTKLEHRELLAILLHHSTNRDKWAISDALKRKVTEGT